jgi:two-component system sensor histidine kinase KdpD
MGHRAQRRPRGGSVRSALVVVLLTAAATSPAIAPGAVPTTIAALLYVLAVVGVSALAGRWAGMAASVISFLALNFFFTPPLHTFTVDKGEDLVALGVFLVVSVVVGTLLSTAVSHRARAERREREARLLHHLSTRLLSGEPVVEVLRSFAQAVTDLFELRRCEIHTELTPQAVTVEGATTAGNDDPETVPMIARGREVGRIVAIPSSARPLGNEEYEVLRTFAGQMGLALEGMRLAREAAGARLDAETSESRAALFSSVTHDLRTPLASITAAVTSLLEEGAVKSPKDRRDLLETSRQEAERLNRLVGNLLDLSRMRAGALTPAKVSSAIDEVVEGVVGRLQPTLDRHDVRLMLRDNLPEVPMDVVQIDQALTNLLENAAKFSRPGSTITVSAARWHDTAEVSVGDQGPGIPEQDRQRVLEPFVRGENGGGAGLGLSIARAIVEAHGGQLRIVDAPGGGTRVIFRLPLR